MAVVGVAGTWRERRGQERNKDYGVTWLVTSQGVIYIRGEGGSERARELLNASPGSLGL